ncbi:hypothetical protein [Mesorhizobium sp. ES1-1]|uniref:hypothetical protein n=1 Tax=Mesorhizobium sp. ES1-1 TaxID=2876629 RepID=UPI001CC9BB00|nr:hypothetical protein [Mesorhizobium sp. ES1-1]MBZ9678812.1 hypothetical protein [Mesorhizobium sp. ES1-1]
MSMHFNVSELTRNLFHSLGLDGDSLNPDQSLLLECYLAGQVPQSAWNDYVAETPALARHAEDRRRAHH